MRAHITIKSQSRRSAWNRVLVLAISVCALAIPASAGAKAVDATTGASSDSSQPIGGGDYSSVNAIAPATSEPGSRTGTELGQAVGEPGGPKGSDSVQSSLNAIAGSPAGALTAVSSPPADSGDGFDWGDAALGAGAALSLAALGGAALFTARRRTTVSPA